jgi:hypothetical protein
MGLLARGDPGWHTRDGQVCREVTVSEAELEPVVRAQPGLEPVIASSRLGKSSSQPQDAPEPAQTDRTTPPGYRWIMIIGCARVSTTEQNLGLSHHDLRPANHASVDVIDARYKPPLTDVAKSMRIG